MSLTNMVQNISKQHTKHTLKNILLTVALIGTINLPVLYVKLFGRFCKCPLLHVLYQIFPELSLFDRPIRAQENCLKLLTLPQVPGIPQNLINDERV